MCYGFPYHNLLRVELFNGTGGVVKGCIQRIDRAELDFMALEDPKLIPLEGTQWHVYAAFGGFSVAFTFFQ